MPGLRDHPWEVSYSTSDVRDDGAAVDLLHDFYLPVLARSSAYDRVAGYFSSTSLATASRGFSRFVAQGGKARFIVGVDLSAEDAEAILRGNMERAEKCLHEALGEEPAWPAEVTRGIELLAWMVAHGHLEVKAAIRVHGADGRPKPFDYEGDGYVHEKWAVFEDGEDALVASGSLNESRTALVLNAENLEIFTSWEGRGAERIRRKRRSFERMWRGDHPNIRTFELPEAICKRLLEIAEQIVHLVEIDGTPAPLQPEATPEPPIPSATERLRFAIIRLAPLLPGGEYVGMETAPVEPWPHQRFVARRIIETYPDNHLMCDEVGLGKTIEAGLAFRSLWLSGRADSIRVFAPASLTSQWLHEMAEKFLLPFRRRTKRSGSFETADPLTGETESGSSDCFDYPLEIISTGLLIHGGGSRLPDSMGPTDIVLLDEAHKARRHEPDQIRREPRFNNLYRAVENGLFPKARSLLLATATPMQLNRVEAFDLLRFMPAAGAVRLSADLCELFYALRDQLADNEPLADYEHRFLRRYLADAHRTAPAQWHFVRNHVLDGMGLVNFDNFVDYDFAPPWWHDLQPALTMLAPLGRTMMRHTRALLREYQRAGRLQANLARRNVQPVIVPLAGQELSLYNELQAYCEELARRIAANMDDGRQRAAIGFYLSFLRLRFASSFHALRRSLARRLEKIERTLNHHADQATTLGTEDDTDELTEEELTGLVLKNREPADLTWEQGAVERLLNALDAYPQTPRKTRELLELIQRRYDPRCGRVRQMVVFTRYGDTLRYLHRELTERLRDCPIGTFSGEGGSLRQPGAPSSQNLNRIAVRKLFVGGHIDILLCTDAAAEGLNLQSADLLVNFDLPWNPMLLEQRIGRIDRIGQLHDRITVNNFLYQGSVEEVVYVRLVDRFREAVSIAGDLQYSLLPIEEQDFQDYAKTDQEPGKIDWDGLLARADSHRQRIELRRRLTEFRAEQQRSAYEALEQATGSNALPVTLDGIWQTLKESTYLASLGCVTEAFPHGEALLLGEVPSIPDGVLLTTSRVLYEHGLPDGDTRTLHFASYGDPVFERLLDYLVGDEEAVRQTWQQRKRIQALATESGEQFGSLAAICNQHGRTDQPLRCVPHSPIIDNVRGALASGERHRQLIYTGAAAIARHKLRDQPDAPSAQLQRIDRFIRDVGTRQPAEFQIPAELPNQSEFLAQAERLFWDIEAAGRNIRLTGDPMLLRVARNIIERALSQIEPDKRTSSGIAERLQRSIARSIS